MNPRHFILKDKNLRYLPAIKENKGIWVYIPADPEINQDSEPIVTEDA